MSDSPDRAVEPGEATTEHERIRRWVERREGEPALRRGDGDDPDTLVLRFPEEGDRDGLDPIGWPEFFRRFEEADVAFVPLRGAADDPDRTYEFVDRIAA